MAEEKQAVVRLKDVLRRNGDEHLYCPLQRLSETSASQPTVVFCWHQVDAFVRAVQAVAPTVTERPPFRLPALLTAQGLKAAILSYVKADGTTPLGTTAVLCLKKEDDHCVAKLAALAQHPWIQAVLKHQEQAQLLPLATIYAPQAHSDRLERIQDPSLGLLWGGQ